MGIRQYNGGSARALSVALVVAGAIVAPTPASISWLSGMTMTFVMGLLL